MTSQQVVKMEHVANNDGEQIKLVEVYIEFTRIGEIDTMNERYQADVTIEAKWLLDEFIQVYDPKQHWNPRLSIENVMTLNKDEVTHKIDNESYNGTLVTETRKVRGVFWERLELENFPMDLQELSITIISQLSTNEVKLIPDRNKVSYINVEAKHTFFDQQKWKLFKMVRMSGVASYDMGSTSTINERQSSPLSSSNMSTKTLLPPKLVASCFSHRRPGFYIFNAYFLIFLITTSALTIFTIDCRLPQNRLQTTYTILLTSVSFKWVVNRSLPTISYLTSLDKYAIISIFFICLLCVWHSLVGTFWTKELAQTIDRWMLLAFGCFLALINLWLLVWFITAYMKVKNLKQQERKFFQNLHMDNYHEKLTASF